MCPNPTWFNGFANSLKDFEELCYVQIWNLEENEYKPAPALPYWAKDHPNADGRQRSPEKQGQFPLVRSIGKLLKQTLQPPDFKEDQSVFSVPTDWFKSEIATRKKLLPIQLYVKKTPFGILVCGFSSASVNITQFQKKIEDILNQIGKEQVGEKLDASDSVLVGKTECFESLVLKINIIKNKSDPFCLFGETGTGKDKIAKYAHITSNRASKPYMSVQLQNIEPAHIPSQIFGAIKGSWTGLDKDMDGVLIPADSGTVFLNEIGRVDKEALSKLLKVVEERKFNRYGEDNVTRYFYGRFIFSSQEKPEELCKRAPDFFHRLEYFVVPPLRERMEDIPDLIKYFMENFPRKDPELGKMGFSPLQISGLSEEAIGLLRSYGWNGNIRELESFIRRFFTYYKGKKTSITAEDLSNWIIKEGKEIIEQQRNITKKVTTLKLNRQVHFPQLFLETKGETNAFDLDVEKGGDSNKFSIVDILTIASWKEFSAAYCERLTQQTGMSVQIHYTPPGFLGPVPLTPRTVIAENKVCPAFLDCSYIASASCCPQDTFEYQKGLQYPNLNAVVPYTCDSAGLRCFWIPIIVPLLNNRRIGAFSFGEYLIEGAQLNRKKIQDLIGKARKRGEDVNLSQEDIQKTENKLTKISQEEEKVMITFGWQKVALYSSALSLIIEGGIDSIASICETLIK